MSGVSAIGMTFPKNERKMQEIMARYNIPRDVPYDGACIRCWAWVLISARSGQKKGPFVAPCLPLAKTGI
jgi:hypothetical protein